MVGLLAVTLLASLAAQTERSAQPVAQEETTQEKRVFWDSGLWFRARRLDFGMKVGGQAQVDTAGFEDEGTAPVDLIGGVEWRRARAYTAGSFSKRWSFKFQWDFTTGRSPNLTDAWIAVDFEILRQQVQLRSGRFSSTFGLENDGSSNDLLFLEQGLTSAFVPPQETGVLLHSESNRRRWDISFSSTADELECLICDVAGVHGRYSTSFELGRPDRRLHAGFNASRRWTTDQAVEYRERPEAHLAPIVVDTGPILAERFDSGLVEGAYLHGAFSLQGEYGFVRPRRTEAESAVFHAFYLSTSYALTGEPRQYVESLGTIRRIRPREELDPDGSGLGALEIAARLSHIDLNDADIEGGSLWDVTLGLNWYPWYSTRVSFNVVRADREAWEPVWIFQSRLQLAF